MKILYIEDELPKNIPRMTRLFGKFLGPAHIGELEALERDVSGYGATPEDIKRIVEASHLIQVEYRFPEALREVLHNHVQYTLFVIDRNLSEMSYTLHEVQAIDPTYDKTQDEHYAGREGDYLLLKLGVCGHANLLEHTYFLTAYSAEYELRGQQEIERLLDLRRFTTNNIIEKGDFHAFERLQNEVDNLLKI